MSLHAAHRACFAALHTHAALLDSAPWRPAAAQRPAAAARHQPAQGCRRQRRLQRCAAYEPSNPQNVPNPQVMPSPDFSPEEAVRVQLEALQANDRPWPNHGVQTAYEFAHDVGGLDPSLYFGFRKDLYHFDHFMGMFNTRLGELLNARSFTIGSTTALPGEPETVAVRVEVQGPQPAAPPAAFEFQLRRKLVGPRKGAWTVHSLTRAEG